MLTVEPDVTSDDEPHGQALVARELRRHRERAGLSRSELARRVGYSRTYIATCEKPGADLASQSVVMRIDEELNAGGALIAAHARANADRRARRRTSADQPEQTARGAAPHHDRAAHADSGTAPHTAHGDLDAMTRAEFLQLAAATVAATTTTAGLAGLLLDPPATGGGSWAAQIHDAVLNPTDHAGRWLDTSPARTPIPRPAIDAAMTTSLTAEYHALDTTLPDLIARGEAHLLTADRNDAAYRNLSDLYAVAGWVLIKADLTVSAWIAANRAVRAAEHAQDAARTAAALRCLAEVHMRTGNHEKASHTALLATVALDTAPTDPDRADLATSLRGAALLTAAAASARHGDYQAATMCLTGAARCAERLGHDRYDLATVFGPTNVAIHRVAVAVELGDHTGAVRLADDVHLDTLPVTLGERRARYLLDLARAHAGIGDASAAAATLLHAESISADEVRHHRITRQLLPDLLARRGDIGLRDLAYRSRIRL